MAEEQSPIRHYRIWWVATQVDQNHAHEISGWDFVKGFDAADAIAIFKCLYPARTIKVVEPWVPA